MKRFTVVLSCLILLLSFTPAQAFDQWTKTDTTFQIAYTTLHVMDWGQTLDISKNTEKWHETNPILGRHPSCEKVNYYFATTLIGHTAIAYILPKDYRRIWQMVWIGIEAGYVIHNASIGIKMRF